MAENRFILRHTVNGRDYDQDFRTKELCGKIGITEANLSTLRSGKAKGVRFGTINKICYYLGCDVGDILKFDGELEGDEDEKE